MSRPLRIEYPGAVYHITSRGNARQSIFLQDKDRETFLEILSDTKARYNWLCHGFCLMDNHYHILIETIDSTLSQGMRQLNGKQDRNDKIWMAHVQYGYKIKEIADCLSLHYTTVSKIINSKKK